jgi:hypothetical protein
MTEESKYLQENLYKGKCSECGTWSTALVKGDGRCIDCIEDEEFYNYQLKLKQNEIKD